MCKDAVACFYEGNPDITNLYPYFTGDRFPNARDLEMIQKLTAENQYDLILNCCPFIDDRRVFPKGQRVLNMLSQAPQIISNLLNHTGSCHFMYRSYGLPYDVLSKIMSPRRASPFKGFPITLADKSMEEARQFLKDKNVPTRGPVFFLNPDSASPFNRIPFDQQLELLKYLLEMPGHVLLGSGFTAKDIEKRLWERLTADELAKVTVVPTSVSLDGYAALIDLVDIFISADTGPLHMAVARKVSKSGNIRFRNKTYIVSIFGATNARMSGYDSTNPLFPAADQDAPSRCYVSQSPCRNITCMNKMAKTCKKVRCFEALDVRRIVGDIRKHLETIQPASLV